MPKYRHRLPQLDGRLFLTDGGLETTLVFHEGIDLPHFAAFDLLRQPNGRKLLDDYFARYATIARDSGMGFVLEGVTWRASPDWGRRLGYSEAELAAINRESIGQLDAVRARFETPQSPMVISGCIGPRRDGYEPDLAMSADEAEDYHAMQIGVFADTEADMVSAITMTNVEEAVGIARGAKAAGMPVVISFTLETDGRLPTSQALGDAIVEVDGRTAGAPAYYMINCAHPTHFRDVLETGGGWAKRIRGIRANASRRSHAELNECTDLDAGDPSELGAQFGEIRQRLRSITVLGGCCGTDHRHVAEISRVCRAAA